MNWRSAIGTLVVILKVLEEILEHLEAPDTNTVPQAGWRDTLVAHRHELQKELLNPEG